VDKIVEVIKEVVKEVEKIVYKRIYIYVDKIVDRVVEKIVEVPVEKIVYRYRDKIVYKDPACSYTKSIYNGGWRYEKICKDSLRRKTLMLLLGVDVNGKNTMFQELRYNPTTGTYAEYETIQWDSSGRVTSYNHRIATSGVTNRTFTQLKSKASMDLFLKEVHQEP